MLHNTYSLITVLKQGNHIHQIWPPMLPLVSHFQYRSS